MEIIQGEVSILQWQTRRKYTVDNAPIWCALNSHTQIHNTDTHTPPPPTTTTPLPLLPASLPLPLQLVYLWYKPSKRIRIMDTLEWLTCRWRNLSTIFPINIKWPRCQSKQTTQFGWRLPCFRAPTELNSVIFFYTDADWLESLSRRMEMVFWRPAVRESVSYILLTKQNVKGFWNLKNIKSLVYKCIF